MVGQVDGRQVHSRMAARLGENPGQAVPNGLLARPDAGGDLTVDPPPGRPARRSDTRCRKSCLPSGWGTTVPPHHLFDNLCMGISPILARISIDCSNRTPGSSASTAATASAGNCANWFSGARRASWTTAITSSASFSTIARTSITRQPRRATGLPEMPLHSLIEQLPHEFGLVTAGAPAHSRSISRFIPTSSPSRGGLFVGAQTDNHALAFVAFPCEQTTFHSAAGGQEGAGRVVGQPAARLLELAAIGAPLGNHKPSQPAHRRLRPGQVQIDRCGHRRVPTASDVITQQLVVRGEQPVVRWP
ncbi:hypothetical protein BCF44_13115 [Kutzneria buriramensis]|uniref:Uncharacterized protein n=2 Tax=Kutzneria buriramensis TaxID=1045776 RepID=A0A3E0GTU0_9PSEU|nr:hypothetical protein BCF44_13115 [Kutzneria buriramensis]